MLDVDEFGDALSVFAQQCDSILVHVQATKNLQKTGPGGKRIFLRIWDDFSKTHQTSPTRVNNNVTSRHFQKRSGKGTGNVNKVDNRFQRFIQRGKTLVTGKLGLFLISLLELLVMTLMSMIILYVIIVNHIHTQAFVSRHTQDLIYPLMRGLRIATLPVIRSFPSLSDLYEEDCLIANPNYFKKKKYDCWPCVDSKQVIDMTGMSNFTAVYQHGGIPFRIRQEATGCGNNFSWIENIYLDNPDFFSTVTLTSNVKSIKTFAQLFPLNATNVLTLHEHLHIAWKIKRAAHARYLRKYFPKPDIIPATTEVSIEHYLFLDNYQSSQYALPFTEFENVFLYQAVGYRRIVLIPTETCFQKCRVLSIVLQDGDFLFYNWLYWRPHSLPVDGEFTNLRCPGDKNKPKKSSLEYFGSFY